MFSLHPTCLVEGISIFGSLQLLRVAVKSSSKLAFTSFWSFKVSYLGDWQIIKKIYFSSQRKQKKKKKKKWLFSCVSKRETDSSALLVLAQNPQLQFPSSLQKVLITLPHLCAAINADEVRLPRGWNSRRYQCTLWCLAGKTDYIVQLFWDRLGVDRWHLWLRKGSTRSDLLKLDS